MKSLIPFVEKSCKENNFDPKMLVDFLKKFFGESFLERSMVAWQPQVKFNVLVIQRDFFFYFEYSKTDNKVKVTSTNIKSIDNISESFDGLNYSCTYSSKGSNVFSIGTDSVELIDALRNITNLILARE